MRGLAKKVVVVTGGGNGIGAAVAKRFGEEGARVAVWDIDVGSAREIADGLECKGCVVEVVSCDITNYDSVLLSVQKTEEKLGPIDILVNNAGWDRFRPFLKTEPKYWDKIIRKMV